MRAGAALIKPSMSLWRWWRPPTDRATVAGWADELAATVRSTERRLREDLRGGPGVFMRVGFTTVSRSTPGETIESADVSDIAAYYELLGPPLPRLVVLGEPGSGKTVAAIHLVLGLLETRRNCATDAQRAEQPVPVRVNAAGWDGERDFSGWLTTRLGYDYPQLRPVLARKLVDDGLILPVIDGLDEMDTPDSRGSRARALLDQLNTTAWRNAPVVVVCRTTEFWKLCELGADNGLHGAATVTLQPLPPDRVGEYLTAYRDAIGTTSRTWTEVSTRISTEPGTALATALHTPWMLGLAVNALHHDPTTAERLTGCATPDAVEDLLFAAQIPAAVIGREQHKRYRAYTSDNVRTWMQTLARCLEHRRNTGGDGTAIRLDEIWELAGPTRGRVWHAATAAVLIAMTAGLSAFVIIGPALLMLGYEPEMNTTSMPTPLYLIQTLIILGLVLGIGFSLAFGLTFGLAVGVVVGLFKAVPATRLVWQAPKRSRWRKGLAVGLVAGAGVGIVVRLVASHHSSGLVVGIIAALTFVLVIVFSADAEDQLRHTVDERHLIRKDLRAAALIGALAGITSIGALLLLAIPRLETSSDLIMEGWAPGLIPVSVWFAIIFVTTFGLLIGRASGRFFTATLIFRRTGIFAARPTVFLDWARRNGLLRVNGTAYQFRHETYRRWLQQPAPSADESPSN